MIPLQRLLGAQGGEARFWRTLSAQLKAKPMRSWTWETWDAFFELAESRGVMMGALDSAGEIVSIGGMFTRPIYRLWAFVQEHRQSGRMASEVMAEWDARVDAARRSGIDSHESYERARAARVRANANTTTQRKPVEAGKL